MSKTKVKNTRLPRRGFSLLEMMVVISVSALLLGIVTSTIFAVRERDRRMRDRDRETAQLFRLAESLRSDVRAGTDVLLSIDGPLVVLAPKGEQIRYELTEKGCVRSVVAAGGQPRKDEFAIGDAMHWHVERLPVGRRPLVALTLDLESQDEESRAAPLIVYAALGADTSVPTAND